jgi:hypothetical protein
VLILLGNIMGLISDHQKVHVPWIIGSAFILAILVVASSDRWTFFSEIFLFFSFSAGVNSIIHPTLVGWTVVAVCGAISVAIMFASTKFQNK